MTCTSLSWTPQQPLSAATQVHCRPPSTTSSERVITATSCQAVCARLEVFQLAALVGMLAHPLRVPRRTPAV
jgi:hypothetical protein